MSTLYIRCYGELSRDPSGYKAPAAHEPGLSDIKVTFTTTAGVSTAFPDGTTLIRVVADAAAHFLVGTAPTATTDHAPIAANVPEYFGVKDSGLKISAIAPGGA